MMRLFSAAGMFIAASISSAMAADIVSSGQPAVPLDSVGHDWSGLYLGGQIGTGHGNADWLEGPAGGPTFLLGAPGDLIFSHAPDGVLYGATFGYNWQFGDWVVGVEGSWNPGELQDETSNFFGNPFDETTTISHLITLGPRIGYAMDRLLIYGEGGWARADVALRAENPIFDTFDSTERHNGYYLGAGIEYALSQNWIVGLEYNHIHLHSEVHADNIPGLGNLDAEIDDVYMQTIMGRILYKF